MSVNNSDLIVRLKDVINTAKKKQDRQFKQRLDSVLELAQEGVRNFELKDEITIDTLLPDSSNKYVTTDGTLILSNLLSDIACSIHHLNTKITDLCEKVDKLETHLDAFESYVNENVRKNKELITVNSNNITTLREKYVKERH